MTWRCLRICLLVALVIPAVAMIGRPANAQSADPPYWASISAEVVNMRVGPSASYPIDWVYTRPGLPVKVVRVNQGWRLVEDPDGVRGWIVARLLSRERGAIVVGEGSAAISDGPAADARILWYVEPGVVGRLGECEDAWCAFDVAGHAGWIEQSRIWGAEAP